MDKFTCNLQGRTYFIPEYMRDSVDCYVNQGVVPGRFLTAIICNNLHDAFSQADDVNFHNVPAYVNYFYNHTPAVCWGSKKKMLAWTKQHYERRKKDAGQPT